MASGMDIERLLGLLDKELTRLEQTVDIWLLYKAKRENKLKASTFKERYIVVDNLDTGARYLVDPEKQRLLAVKHDGQVYVEFLGKLVPYGPSREG